MKSTKKFNMENYCCYLKCVNIKNITHVDGRACRKCNNFGYCICKCKTFIVSKNNVV